MMNHMLSKFEQWSTDWTMHESLLMITKDMIPDYEEFIIDMHDVLYVLHAIKRSTGALLNNREHTVLLNYIEQLFDTVDEVTMQNYNRAELDVSSIMIHTLTSYSTCLDILEFTSRVM